MRLTRRNMLGLTAGAGLTITGEVFWSRPAAAADAIKLGAPFNVTGGLSSLDAPALNGAKLKAKEINDAGGVLGKKIELVVYDTKTDPTVIASVASQLINQDKVHVAVGFTDSDSVLALGPIFQQAGITQPIVGGDGYDTPLLVQVGGKASDEVYFSTHAYMAADSTPPIQKFYKDYKAAYGTDPENAFAALGYDTVGLVADAIKRAGTDDQKAIRDAIAATSGYAGVTGTI